MLKYQVRTLNRRCASGHRDEHNSSGSSRADSGVSLRGRSTSVSSLSSASSSSEHNPNVQWGTVKVFTEAIRADTDYKTLFVSNICTTDELIKIVLNKFRLTHKDAKLFYLCMQLRTVVNGTIYESELTLDDHAHPLELQACHPRQMSRFVLRMRPGALVRIHDRCINPLSNYKSVVISADTTVQESIQLLLVAQRDNHDLCDFCLVCVDRNTSYECTLPSHVPLLSVINEDELGAELHLRRRLCDPLHMSPSKCDPLDMSPSKTPTPQKDTPQTSDLEASPEPPMFQRTALSSRALHRRSSTKSQNVHPKGSLFAVAAQFDRCHV